MLPITDPAQDVLQYGRIQPLDVFFKPKTVAVIGATEKEGSVGRTLLWNLISSPFGGTVFPVNPKRPSVLGIQAYPSLSAIPAPIDLVIIAIPAKMVSQVMDECIAKGVKGAIIISAGFKEIGPAGVALEQEILAKAKAGRIRIIGPNCLGMMSPIQGLNATFASAIARPGNVGFISQSGALCTSILDWSFRENVGFSAFISIGSMLDVNWGDLIDYLGDDPATHSIVIYMETIGDARSFLSAARAVALTKPIIVIKAGRTEAAAAAAASHTGALAGSDEVLNAAFRRCGVLRVDTIDDLFNMAEVLAKQPRPKGKRLTILTNAGGPGVLSTDALISQGGELAQLSPETQAAFDAILPAHWSHANPIDILGDADPERYAKAIEIALKDPHSDALLVILTPQAMTDPTETARRFVEILQKTRYTKPILASWMGGEGITPGEQLLNDCKIFTLPFPDGAVHVFNYMWRYAYNLNGLYETPHLPDEEAESRLQRTEARQILQQVRAEGRSLLTEYESKQLLEAYGIPTVLTKIAHTAEAAVEQAEKIGYPVVLKLNSTTITHKTDVGGVRLLLQDAESVQNAYHAMEHSVAQKVGPEHFQGVTVQPMLKMSSGDYELIIGSSMDVQFGPVLLFGTGGSLVEVFKDRALGIPPLNTTLARRMMEQTKIYTALQGVRGQKAVDLNALEQLLVRFSQLVMEQPWIKEIDINPLLASPQRLIALDARVVLHPPDAAESQGVKTAICPYPLQYMGSWTMGDGTMIMIRPIRPEDEPLLRKFHEPLSEESVYLRYFHLVALSARVAHDRLSRLCFIDYDREMALVATKKDERTGELEILGIGRLSPLHEKDEAEFSMMVGDRYQNQGIGTEVLHRLVKVGRDRHIKRIKAEILPQNGAMQRVCEKVGFHLHRTSPDVAIAELHL
ncbi:bifunctional acetate--CoA ligase family protein/GNAT family N-acetyltransferase [Spirulina subsalsa FACHB-351]|uniref:Bifunctional acetate--CoA ligase family protein/GNAT family N-acetyltransferase n=1 Tax=Spirulina subsalsa FACHB-351 TaxID=234711 RepID=A0ABT3LBE7_9CYAN|nr:bifunctional acetate--CoA ligase family protein/GNAT family N-acetyltransferase [Spirulina subsalsa]MCW6038442.1 bifunctional acetate--CoA ligase family protein/GNAT family N-acetyltransferase [Spirulina subsalsa FACHB-351]